MTHSAEDHAGLEYWEGTWQRLNLPELWDVDSDSLRGYVDRSMFAYMLQAFRDHDLLKANTSLIEVGAARSAVLPLFNSKLGFSVSGIDYSPTGCEQIRAILAREGVAGEVFQSDVFSPPSELIGRFDVLVSIGLVEHFSDTKAIVSALAALLKPGGVMITSIPNMNGLVGFVQKMLDREVFDIHVPLDADQLGAGHRDAGLDVEACDYFLPSNFGVCNINIAGGRGWTGKCKRLLLAVLRRLSMVSWWVETRAFKLPVSRMLSPYVNCVAVKSK